MKRKSNNVVYMNTRSKIPNYLTDKRASNQLAKRIEQFWHNKGYLSVKAWVETHQGIDGSKTHMVRSNITFTVPTKESLEK
jgi:hypothetical protein